jgi:hypothetical protein
MHARGTGWAKDVAPESWVLFNERLAQARLVLEAAKKLPTKDPEWFTQMLELARLQGWPLTQYDDLYFRAVRFEPAYYTIYRERAYWMLPRWHGEEGQWQKFALEASETAKKQIGEDIYGRIVTQIWGLTDRSIRNAASDNFLKTSGISWERLKVSFENMEKHYPSSILNENAYCAFACMAGDKETARGLFNKIGIGGWYRNIWGSAGQFVHCKNWAEYNHNW